MVASKQRSGSYAISTHGRFRAARSGKIRTIKAKKNRYAETRIKNVNFLYHCLQAAAFPEICGRLTADRNTWDHKHNDRDDPTYMHATNLRPASMSEQSLNQTTSDNWIEGRRLGSQDEWIPFRNSGRAAVKLQKLEPEKNWNQGNIFRAANGERSAHGWEFRFRDPEKAVRIAAPETPQLDGETWRTLVLPGGEVVPQCEVSDMGRYRNSRGRTWTPTPARGHRYASILHKQKRCYFHNCVAATFADIVGPNPGGEYTIGHQDIDTTNNKVANLRWEDRSTQALNKSNSDNWIEGRRVGSQDAWMSFRNAGRAEVGMREIEPGKIWRHGDILRVANGVNKTTHGWEFRFRDPEKVVRNVTSTPTEPQWRDEPEYAGERWARLEPLGNRRFRVTSEHRDGTEGTSFEVDLSEYRGDDSASGSSEED